MASEHSQQASPDPAALERVRVIRREHEDDLMALPNVVAVGVGLRGEQVAIVVSVTHKVPLDELEPAERIPSELDGVPVAVQATGPLVAGAT